MFVSGKRLDGLYIYACQEQVCDVGVAELVRRHMEINAVNNIAVVCCSFAKHRLYNMGGFHAVLVSVVGSLFGGPCTDILP